VAAIIDQQPGCQAALARTQGNQEAAVKRLSRLLHNDRLTPKDFAAWLCRQALRQVPRTGRVRFPIDWTSEAPQHLLVVSLVVGRRALPIFWRAYDQTVLKGRMKRYELAVVKRAFKLIFQYVAPQRVRLTADRGFADATLFALLDTLGIRSIIRVKGDVKVEFAGQWRQLNPLRFAGNARRRNLGRLPYCASSPQRLWITLSRARDKTGRWGIWYLASNRPLRAQQMAKEYGHRFCCEEGFRDAKWSLGFAKARITAIRAWSRLFALFVIALLVLTSVGTRLLLHRRSQGRRLLRRVASRRRDRCALSLIAAVVALLQQDRSLLGVLSAHTKLKLEATLSNVS
jgi:Transposase DDE domain